MLESSMRPKGRVTVNPPAALKGMAEAQREWRRAMRIYNQIEAEIVTKLDTPLLIQYCTLYQQLAEMDAICQALIRAKSEELDIDAIVKMDARLDRKRALIFQMQQSLYLTPRSRAAKAPKPKEQEQPKDDLEKLLDDVTDYVNGPKP